MSDMENDYGNGYRGSTFSGSPDTLYAIKRMQAELKRLKAALREAQRIALDGGIPAGRACLQITEYITKTLKATERRGE